MGDTAAGRDAARIEAGGIEVAEVARLLSRAGLVGAFGHVSARTADGFEITATTVPLGSATTASVNAVSGEEPTGKGIPLEAPLHAAVYAARPDVGAICRTHSPAAVAAGAGGAPPPVTHGLGGLSGELSAFEEPQLVTERGIARRAAGALGTGDCLLLRGNGALATGRTLGHAAVRAWYLEERARVWLEAGGAARPLSDAELVERSRHWSAESERAWSWLRSRFCDSWSAGSGTGARA